MQVAAYSVVLPLHHIALFVCFCCPFHFWALCFLFRYRLDGFCKWRPSLDPSGYFISKQESQFCFQFLSSSFSPHPHTPSKWTAFVFLMDWTVVPKKICPGPNPSKLWPLLYKQVLAYVIKDLDKSYILCIIQVDPVHSHIPSAGREICSPPGFLSLETDRHTDEEAAMWPWRQRLELHSHKPRNDWSHQWLYCVPEHLEEMWPCWPLISDFCLP